MNYEKVEIQHVGFNDHRLTTDPYSKHEVLSAELMDKMIESDGTTIPKICGLEYMEESEERIALSVIQWLGTPVGKSFINEVFGTDIQ